MRRSVWPIEHGHGETLSQASNPEGRLLGSAVGASLDPVRVPVARCDDLDEDAIAEVERDGVVGRVAGREPVGDEPQVGRPPFRLGVVMGREAPGMRPTPSRSGAIGPNESVVAASNQQFAPALVPLRTIPRRHAARRTSSIP